MQRLKAAATVARGSRARWRVAWSTRRGLRLRKEVGDEPSGKRKGCNEPLSVRWPFKHGFCDFIASVVGHSTGHGFNDFVAGALAL